VTLLLIVTGKFQKRMSSYEKEQGKDVGILLISDLVPINLIL